MFDIRLKTKECMPKLGSKNAAGMDLRAGMKTAAGYIAVAPGESISFCTGVACAIPEGWVGLVAPRSGLGTKFKLRLDNTIGVIDSDYRGWIKVMYTNCGSETAFIEDFERIAQMVIVPHMDLSNVTVVDELPETERGEGGFGHSGKL